MYRSRRFSQEPPAPRLLVYTNPESAPLPRRLTYRSAALTAQSLGVPKLVLRGPAVELDPIVATDLLLALHSLELPLMLELTASATLVELAVLPPTGQADLVERAIRGAAPQFDLDRRDAQLASGPALRLVGRFSQEGRASLAPMRELSSFQAGADPLGSLLEGVQPLAPDERLELHYLLVPTRPERFAQLHQELFVSFHWFFALLLGISAGPYPRFEPRTQQLLEARVYHAFECLGLVSLVGDDRARLQSRARSLTSLFKHRYDSGYGGIALHAWAWSRTQRRLRSPLFAESSWLLISCVELASLWHPPSRGLAHIPGVSFLRRPTVPVPALLLQPSGILLGLHHQRGGNVEVRASLDDVRKSPMILIVGKTGMGKSELNKQIVTELYKQPGLNPSCLVLDPNYDLVRDLTALTPKHLRDQTYLLDHGDIDFPPGCPLMALPTGVAPERFIEQTYTLFRSLFAENWSESRMADLIYALIVTLVSTPDATLWHAPKLLSDPSYRRGAVARLKDPVAIDYWREFEQLSPGAKREVIRPVTARLRRLLRVQAVRNIVCRTDGPDLGQLLNSGARVYLSTAGPDIRSVSDLLLEIYLIKAHLSLEARLSNDGPRHPTVICVDESPRFTGPTLPILLREGRKMGLTALTISTQYLKAWGETLSSDAVLGNVASLIAFQCGADDASKLSSMIKPFSPDELQNLDIYEAIVRLSAGGSTYPAFDIKTLRVETEPDWETFEYIKENSRRLFGKPRAEIEQSFGPDQDDSEDQDGDWLLE